MESHIVGGNFNYIELVDSWPDHYTCCNCMTVVLECDFKITRMHNLTMPPVIPRGGVQSTRTKKPNSKV